MAVRMLARPPAPLHALKRPSYGGANKRRAAQRGAQLHAHNIPVKRERARTDSVVAALREMGDRSRRRFVVVAVAVLDARRLFPLSSLMDGRRKGGRKDGRTKRGIDIVMSNEPKTSLVLALSLGWMFCH